MSFDSLTKYSIDLHFINKMPTDTAYLIALFVPYIIMILVNDLYNFADMR